MTRVIDRVTDVIRLDDRLYLPGRGPAEYALCDCKWILCRLRTVRNLFPPVPRRNEWSMPSRQRMW